MSDMNTKHQYSDVSEKLQWSPPTDTTSHTPTLPIFDERVPSGRDESLWKSAKWMLLTICKAIVTTLGVIAFLHLSKKPMSLPSFASSSTKPYSAHHLRSHCANIPAISNSEFQDRQARLSEALSSNALSAYIAEPGPSAQYFANISSNAWHTSERPLLLVILPPSASNHQAREHSSPKILLLTPKFETTRAKQLIIPMTNAHDLDFVEWAEDENPYQVLYDHIFSSSDRNVRSRKVAIDGQARLFVAQGLSQAGFTSGREVPDDVARLRERKSDAELTIMRCVNEATLLAIRDVREHMHLGMKESDASRLMQRALTDAGLAHQGLSTAAQFGDHAALPHGGPTDKALTEHDMITFDVGGSLHGYWSDVTRTFALPQSQIPSGHLQIWKVVQNAQSAALTMAKAGVVAEDVDAAARLVIEEAGYGERFTHRLGHGIGLEMHESPYLRGGYKRKIETGNTFSNEPGIYVEGKVGVRLEDCMVIDKDGQAVLLTAEVGGAARSPWMP
ncbi:hypothetical protein FRB97_008800 [Tulasnella sp. 331]|nr:hypothetical protein FRB97_008800 [Tulasnella sp. 331]